MTRKIYIFDSHPVQYKAPVYQALNALCPDTFEVIYATDVSVRKGNIDKDFGKEVAWDTPLLTGYPYRVLNNERGVPLSSPSSLTGKGVFGILKAERPAAVLLTQAHYWFDHTAYLSALLLGIPVLIRQETQDEMFSGKRPWLKEKLRALVYRLLYAPVKHAFAFGELNYKHLVRHGVTPERISFARFSVPNPIADMTPVQKEDSRTSLRQTMQLSHGQIVISFFGKLIPKKNPELIFEALQHVPHNLRQRLHIMVVGAGELQSRLNDLASKVEQQWGVRASFMGFINQSKLPAYYLASDIVVLPSRRMGEAWGLVVNEALNAGCAVVVSDAVGCVSEFGDLPRVEVIPVEDHVGLANAIGLLAELPRDVDWAKAHMGGYSSEAAARSLGDTFNRYLR